MKSIHLKPLNDKVLVQTETNLLESLLAQHCEIAMACGGQGICATCHVYVKEGKDALSPPTVREQRTLSLITSSNNNSRLSCQARVIGEGLVVELPEGMYLRTAGDLSSLIGRRTEVPILHPKDGRILVEKGKIITKSRILELQGENYDVLDVMNKSERV
jgi:ferredoxin